MSMLVRTDMTCNNIVFTQMRWMDKSWVVIASTKHEWWICSSVQLNCCWGAPHRKRLNLNELTTAAVQLQICVCVWKPVFYLNEYSVKNCSSEPRWSCEVLATNRVWNVSPLMQWLFYGVNSLCWFVNGEILEAYKYIWWMIRWPLLTAEELLRRHYISVSFRNHILLALPPGTSGVSSSLCDWTGGVDRARSFMWICHACSCRRRAAG